MVAAALFPAGSRAERHRRRAVIRRVITWPKGRDVQVDLALFLTPAKPEEISTSRLITA